jgi:hypothetical protein
MRRQAAGVIVGVSMVASLLSPAGTAATTEPLGGRLVADAPATTLVDELLLDDVSAFDPGGGWALLDSLGQDAELFAYAGADPERAALLFPVRLDPRAHPAGTFVAAVDLGDLVAPDAAVAHLAADLDDEVGFDARIALDDATGFVAPGWAVIDASEDASELVFFSGVEADTNELVGVARLMPQPHAAGTEIAALPGATSSADPLQEEGEEASPSEESGDDPEPEEAPQEEGEESPLEPSTGTSSAAGCDPKFLADCLNDLIGDPGIDPGPVVQDLIQAIQDWLDHWCPDGRCINDTIETMTDLIAQVCRNLECVNEALDLVQQIVAALIDNLCPNLQCGQDVLDLISDLLQSAIDNAYKAVCGNKSESMCISDYLAIVLDLVNWAADTAYEAVCGSQSAPNCASDYLNIVLDLVNWAMDTAYKAVCGTKSATNCVNDYVAIVDGIITDALEQVRQQVCGSKSWDMCVNDLAAFVVGLITGIVNTVYNATCGSKDPQKCVQDIADDVVQIVNGVINTVYNVVCPTQPWAPDCISDYAETVSNTVDSLLNTVCSSDTSSGYQACIDMVDRIVSQALEDAYQAVCGPNDLSGCIAMYNEVIEALLNTVCSSDTSSGPQACIDMAERIVDSAIDTVCDSQVGMGADGSGINQCVELVEQLVAFVIQTIYDAVCPTQPWAPDCVADYAEAIGGKVDAALSTVCGDQPMGGSSTGAAGVEDCDRLVEELKDWLLKTVCPPDGSSRMCTAQYEEEIEEILGTSIDPCDVLFECIPPPDCDPLYPEYCAGHDDPLSPGTLPLLPPLHILEPGEFDEDGCELPPHDEDGPPDCGPLVEPDTIEETDPWLHLLGFSGFLYTTDLTSDAVVLLEDSLSLSTSGSWEASGLVRNETSNDAVVGMSATLFDADGREVGTYSATLPLEQLRPGEPGPFTVRTEVPATEVSDVEWAIHAEEAIPSASRRFQILTYWEVPYGDRARFDLVYEDPPIPPYPYVLSGEVENLGRELTGKPKIVAAWLDEDRRVVEVTSVQAGEVPFASDTAPEFPESLSARATIPFFLAVEDAEVGPALDGAIPMLWAVENLASQTLGQDATSVAGG